MPALPINLRRFYDRLDAHATTGNAAQVAYYALFAIFPFLLFLITLTAYLPLGNPAGALLARFDPLLPAEATAVLRAHLFDLLNHPRPHLLTAGLLVSLWSASRAIDAFRTTLNIAHDARESRPFWRTQGLALLFTIASALLIPLVLLLLAAGGRIGLWVAAHLHIEPIYVFVWSWARWPVTALVAVLGVSLLYFFLPDVRRPFREVLPGAIFGTLTWLIVTWSFSHYVATFGNDNATYGSLGGVIVLLSWFYLSALTVLVGGELNAELAKNSS